MIFRGSPFLPGITGLLFMMARRWALRVIWELHDGTLSFRALQAAAGTSPSVLNTRLTELRDAGIVELVDGGYRLTREGQGLLASLNPLADWAGRWAARS
jgi:DNA-binding HxlR family transcriptional regulator